MTKVLVSLEKVSKTYQLGSFDVHALKDVSVSFLKGEFVVILGPSGSGKTTLLNMIGGLDSVSAGEITVDDQRIDQLHEKELTTFRKTKTGFIFQFFNLIPTLTAFENVALAAELSGGQVLTPEEVLAAVGLQDRADHFPSQLSGGEQQRVAIARALAKNAPLMLCDEPTGELDAETGVSILKTLRDLCEKYQKTFLIVTHNAVIGECADRVVRLHSGEIAQDTKNEQPKNPKELSW